MNEKLIKIIFCGSPNVGKSSIILQYCQKKFNNNNLSTIGVDFNIKKIKFKKKILKLQIWDQQGGLNLQTITKNYYRGTDFCILMFDLTNEKTLTNLSGFIEEVKKCSNNVHYILIGNKIDLIKDKILFNNKINCFINKHNLKYIKTSAKKNKNIDLLFNIIIENYLKKNINSFDNSFDNSFINLSTKNNKSNHCC